MNNLKKRKESLPGLIRDAAEAAEKTKAEAEKCKQKEEEDKKKKKEEEERKKTEAEKAGGNNKPAEETTSLEGKPCQPEGEKKNEVKRMYYSCELEETELSMCNTSSMNNKVLEAIKKAFEKSKKLKGPLEIAGKIADCASTKKAVCVNITISRKWEDIKYTYECVNGKWVIINKSVVAKGKDNYGTFQIVDKNVGSCCWIFDNTEASKSELAQAIQAKLDECK